MNDQYAPPVPYQKPRPLAKEYKRLFLTATIFGAALLLYLGMSDILVYILQGSERLYALYMNDRNFEMLFGAVYTVVCVFLPFLLVYWLLRRVNFCPPVPLGGAYEPVGASLLLFAGLGACFAGSIVSGWFSVFLQCFGLEFYSVEYQQTPPAVAPLPLLLFLLQSAVLPALFEEFAFRGVILQSLRRYGDWFAIVTSAVLFGLVHGNMLQMPFAILAGIALGYCCVVSGSLWLSVAIHFLNNLVSVLYFIVDSLAGEQIAYLFSAAVTYASIAVGAVCMLVYVLRNRAFFRLRPPRHRTMRRKGWLVLLAPSVLLATVSLAGLVLSDIIGFTELLAKAWSNLLYYFGGGYL